MNFVSKRWWFILISFLVISPGVISMFIPPAFKLGLDFTSGSELEAEFEGDVKQEQLRAEMAKLGFDNASIRKRGAGPFLITTRQLAEAEGEAKSEKEIIEEALVARFGPLKTEIQVETVSPLVAGETVRNAVIAVIIATIAILFYIIWAFRKMIKPFRMGVAAIVALLHDVLLVLGLFSILGKFLDFEINTMFITGILIVVGYSVNDTIIVFDRIRENALRGAAPDLDSVVNLSLTSTLGRSLNTTLTTVLTVLALLFIGGSTLKPFLLVLLVGFITGAYSSVGVASQLLIIWEKGEWLKPFRWRKKPAPEASPAGS